MQYLPLNDGPDTSMDCSQKGRFEIVDLSAIDDGRVESVRLYPSGAQITRVFKTQIHPGHNQVVIWYLPTVIETQSIRVKIQGAATILGVSTLKLEKQKPDRMSPCLRELQKRKSKAEKALYRAKNSQTILSNFVSNLHLQHLTISEAVEAASTFDTVDEGLSEKFLILEQDIIAIDQDILDENVLLAKKAEVDNLVRTQVTLDFFANSTCEIEITLSYDVESSSCTWNAEYDINVDTKTPQAAAKVTYHAVVSQNTGESWEDVLVTLDTKPQRSRCLTEASNQFMPWHVKTKTTTTTQKKPSQQKKPMTPQAAYMGWGMHPPTDYGSDDEQEVPDQANLPLTKHAYISEGHIHSLANTTYTISDKVTVPKDGKNTRISIASFDLDANLTWSCIPKHSNRAFLKGSIKNSSEFTIISGECNVFISNNFVARSKILETSPGGSFVCDLGFDPFIQITYHGSSERILVSEEQKKFHKHSFTENFAIRNMNPFPIATFKVTDFIPVSEDANITVDIIEPKLARHSTDAITSATIEDQISESMVVSEGILVQWNGADDSSRCSDTLGKDGVIDWICTIPAQSKIDLVLKWEVSALTTVEIDGLYQAPS